MKRFFAALAALLGLSHGLSAAETCLDAGGSQNLVQTAVRALKLHRKSKGRGVGFYFGYLLSRHPGTMMFHCKRGYPLETNDN